MRTVSRRYASVVVLLLAALLASGCCDIIPGCAPLTPGHRDFEGDIRAMKLDAAGNREWFRLPSAAVMAHPA